MIQPALYHDQLTRNVKNVIVMYCILSGEIKMRGLTNPTKFSRGISIALSNRTAGLSIYHNTFDRRKKKYKIKR